MQVDPGTRNAVGLSCENTLLTSPGAPRGVNQALRPPPQWLAQERKILRDSKLPAKTQLLADGLD